MNDVSGRPSDMVMAEFRTVARRSGEFLAALAKSNQKPDYCPDQVEDICRTLLQLPDGTTIEGREILDYSGKRLPDLRREMFPFDDLTRPGEGSSSRDDLLDDRLSLLIAAVTTATATIDREAGNRPLPEPPPRYISNNPPSDTNAQLAHDAGTIADQLDAAGAQIKEMAVGESPRIERLRRTIIGTRGLHVLARSELLFREVAPGWLRKLKGAIDKTPYALRAAQRGINLAVDIGKPFYDQSKKVWDDLDDLAAKHIKLFAHNLGKAAYTIETSRLVTPTQPPLLPPLISRPYDAEEVHAMILRGEAPPPEWIPYVTELNFFGDASLDDIEPLRGLVNLSKLDLGDASIYSIDPLINLVNLTHLNLWKTDITNIDSLQGLINLTHLNLSETKIKSVEPLRRLVKLEALDLSRTKILDFEPLERLVNLKILDLFFSSITDAKKITELPKLALIHVDSLKRAEYILPQLGEGWRIERSASYQYSYELRRDVRAVIV